MKTLNRHLTDYLEFRRGLGFDLGRAESRLRSFLAFMKAKRTPQITTPLRWSLRCGPITLRLQRRQGACPPYAVLLATSAASNPRPRFLPLAWYAKGTVRNRTSTPGTRSAGYWRRLACILQRRGML